jgi:hypothetical protein
LAENAERRRAGQRREEATIQREINTSERLSEE